MFKNWAYRQRERSPLDSEDTMSSEPPWLVLKVGGLYLELDQASARAIGPTLPGVLRLGWRSLPYIGCALIGGIGSAGVSSKLLEQPVHPADPVIEEVCPQK